MDLDEARAVVAEQHRAVLATRRSDGTPQMSPVLAAVDAQGRVVVSTSEDGAQSAEPPQGPARMAVRAA